MYSSDRHYSYDVIKNTMKLYRLCHAEGQIRPVLLKFSDWQLLNQEATKLTIIFQYFKNNKVLIIVFILQTEKEKLAILLAVMQQFRVGQVAGRSHLAREKDKV